MTHPHPPCSVFRLRPSVFHLRSSMLKRTFDFTVLFFSMEAPLYIFVDKALQQFGTMDVQKAA